MIITLALGKPRINSLLFFFQELRNFWMHYKQVTVDSTWLIRRFLLSYSVLSYNFLTSLVGKLRHQGLEKSCARLQGVLWRAGA